MNQYLSGGDFAEVVLRQIEHLRVQEHLFLQIAAHDILDIADFVPDQVPFEDLDVSHSGAGK